MANYTYYKDNTVAALTYTDTAGVPLVPATPGVTYAYDPVYPRLTSMTDGVGTTRYTYNPIPPAPITTPVTGVGRLATIDGPLSNDTIAYNYDALGRQLSASINGAANTMAVTYDALGRVATQTNALGTFTYGYVGVTGRLDHLDYPSGQRANFGYYPNTAAAGTGNGDQRLRQIQHLKPGGSVLSTFTYTYDPVGQIQSWAQQTDAGAALTSTYRYDAAGQLIGAIIPSSGSGSRGYVYGYDLAGNRTEEQIDAGVTTSSYNNLNQLTGQSAGGRMSFSGTVNEPSTVSLAGTPASVDTSNRWRGQANVSAGANAISLVATDVNGNVTNKTINVTVASGGARTLSYDLAGNLVDDGAGKTYGWDALNRLVKITQGANVMEFVYDGNGRRVQEKLNGTLIKQWIWCDGPQPCEERDAAGNVTKRFYSGLGEQIAGTNYYYSTDHLGSIREMTDSTGAVRARYSYDPYGRISKISGDLEADFGFTGFYRHQASGLNLTIYRAYDPELGRWLSRDPKGEEAGLNLYAYVSNGPIGAIDPLGLDKYFGGSREGGGHFWVAVDQPGGGVIRYDYGAAGYTGTGGHSSGPVGAAFSTLSTQGQANVTWYPSPAAAAGSNEYYAFKETEEADAAVRERMFNDVVNDPHYGLLTHNCVDGSCAVGGFPGLAYDTVRPQSALDAVKDLWNKVYGKKPCP